VIFAVVLGVSLGLIAGYGGGKLDSFIMRVADVQLSFPAILIALLIDGVARAVLPRDAQGPIALFVLIFAIGISNWVQYARTVRGSTLVEKNKEYIQAARVIGIRPFAIIFITCYRMCWDRCWCWRRSILRGNHHRSDLSFLKSVFAHAPVARDLDPRQSDFLFSGEWWITLVQGALVIMVLAIGARRLAA
jgi:peptide/nickel transport system permease protein